MRTEIGTAIQHINKRWSINFITWVGVPGNQRVHSTATSAAVWSTEDLAYNAGERALNIVESTGQFPNMTEVW